MNRKNPNVDAWLRQGPRWEKETKKLRAIALGCGLTEEWKWRQPSYTFEKRIVVLITGFKEYCALAFFKGALLKDARRLLVKPGENCQAIRQMRFTGVRQITAMEPLVKAYLREAIGVQKAGLKVKKNTVLILPEELQRKFRKMPALKKAFGALTLGRQRAYVLHISAAKQSATRASRIEKHTQRILQGKGMYD